MYVYMYVFTQICLDHTHLRTYPSMKLISHYERMQALEDIDGDRKRCEEMAAAEYEKKTKVTTCTIHTYADTDINNEKPGP